MSQRYLVWILPFALLWRAVSVGSAGLPRHKNHLGA